MARRPGRRLTALLTLLALAGCSPVSGQAGPTTEPGTSSLPPTTTVPETTETTSCEVLVEDGTAVGIRGHADGGSEVVERARVVIGAAGHHSRVARALTADRYHGKPVLENAAEFGVHHICLQPDVRLRRIVHASISSIRQPTRDEGRTVDPPGDAG